MPRLFQPPRDAVTKRLARSLGHFQSTLDQLKRGRPTAEVAQQLHAVEAAINAAKVELVRDQMLVALRETKTDDGTLRRLQTLANYLQ